MELAEIVAALEENRDRTFPRQAVEQAIAAQDAITPVFLATLEEYNNNPTALAEKPSYFLHIYALYLLAQFRETRAYPLILEFFSTPGEITLDITGDVVTEDLGRILASVYD
jgi:hypothetical protein